MTGSARAKTKLAPPALLAGRYRFDAPLGRGRFGRVVRARDERSRGALRALKCVAATDGARLLLEHEVLDGQQLRQILAGEPIEVRVPKPVTPPPAPPREVKGSEGERAGGILPPPVVAPKPSTS